MKDRPILMSAPMVRATLDESKTQTRRVAPITMLDIKPLPGIGGIITDIVTWCIRFSKPTGPDRSLASYSGAKISKEQANALLANMYCRHGRVGDRLWVREAWRAPLAYELTPPRDIPPGTPLLYKADGSGSLAPCGSGRYRPPVFMPRWASRILLEITAVRVERLQDISEEDARAEGVDYDPGEGGTFHVTGLGCASDSAAGSFRRLWESINGPDAWDANPWVWVIEFKRVTQ